MNVYRRSARKPPPPPPVEYDETDDMIRLLRSSSRRSVVMSVAKGIGLVLLCLVGVIITIAALDYLPTARELPAQGRDVVLR
jgi:hypothetical protein